MAKQVIKSINLLPEIFRTGKNTKFLASTIDQLIQQPDLERIDGYIGSKLTPTYISTTNNYISESLSLRRDYQLEPALVIKDNSVVTDVIGIDDLANEISTRGGNNTNFDRLFRSEVYSYHPHIDWDKLVNYQEYYWLVTGPTPITIESLDTDVVIDVELEISGKSSYTSPTGVVLTNGMKVRFTNTVLPTSYREKEYFIEGVGTSIKLIDYISLTSSQSIKNIFNDSFDTTIFDDYPFDNYKSLPLVPEYITINRASRDLNPWSKYNRWVHSSVIKASAEANNQLPVYPANLRAKRPIIEFASDLKLYNFGSVGIANIDFIDTTTTDAFSKVEGSAGYYADGVLLEQGHTVIFNADTDSTVRNKIFRVNYVKLNGRTRISLEKIIDPSINDGVNINSGETHAGTNWWFNGNVWNYSQQHNELNQSPLFDLFDTDGNSYSDINYYLGDFKGNKIFGYDVGTGSNDSVLGFPLKYKNSSGVGSFLFKNYFMTDIISISDSRGITEVATADTNLKFVNDNSLATVWTAAENYQVPIIQFQSIKNQSTSTLEVVAIDSPGNAELTLEIFLNNDKLDSNLYTTSKDGNQYFVNFVNSLVVGDNVQFKIYTNATVNENGYYELPLSLTNNPLNGPISSLTLSELSDHLNTAVHRSPDFVGNFPGVSNLRDISNIATYANRLVSSANPMSFANFFIGKKEHNAIDAITKVADQYNQFKISLLKQISKNSNQNDPVVVLDQALKEINLDKDILSPYYLSDMIAYGTDKTLRTWTVTDSRNTVYPIASDFTLDKLSLRSVLVYLNGIHLVNGIDYEFIANDSTVQFLTTLTAGDKIDIYDYYSTKGSFVPPTPTKLGLYPKFTPCIFQDTSYINGPVNVIQGHDGSITVAYNDFRDAVILEFEKRVYNNIKVAYRSELLDFNSVMPGAFRSTEYSTNEINGILQSDFIKWTGFYGIDYSTNNVTVSENSRTWNYQGGYSNIVNKPVYGYWRAVLKYFYDTDRPDTHPWEMLGFTEKPSWWEDEYGPAPYTSGNELLWDDLESGTIRQGSRVGVNVVYARPKLKSLLPVDNTGMLVDTSTLLSTITEYNKRQLWKFSDQGPSETTWRRSSYWPFAVQRLLALTKPASYASLMYDTSRVIKNFSGQLTYGTPGKFLNIKTIFVHDDNDTLTSGYSVFVSEVGQQRSKDYVTRLKTDLSNVDLNLFYKVGGFVSKDKLQILIDAYDPTTTGPGALLPQENYDLILNTSNPVKSIGISGIIIQIVGDKFIVQGYDNENPYFTVYEPTRNSNTPTITVGGISESYVTWTAGSASGGIGLTDAETTTASAATTGKFYQAGQLVSYGNSFYRVKVSHQSGSTFNTAYFQSMPSLPVTGGATVQAENGFSTTTKLVPYKTEFSKIQEVYDLIIGYGKWLESQGFLFDNYSSEFNSPVDWYFSGKEFLYWTTQNWANRSIITLSPFADKLKYQLAGTVVDNIFDSFYQYSLLNASGLSFPQGNISVTRDDGVCTIETVNSTDGIYFAVIHSVQKEHAMVFNNTTIFNDTIYDIETGYRQRRMKLSGFRTANWNGDYFSPGFIYDAAQISEWQQYTDYKSGDVVRFASYYYSANDNIAGVSSFDFTKWTKLGKKPVAGLLPNFDYKINQFEDFYSLDIDNFDSAQQKMAQHLTGYTPRVYLNNIFTNPISQYKFYQGFIKEKGTRNAINKLSKATVQNFQGQIDFKEEWAFRIGSYGAYETYRELEVPLNEGAFLENPQVVKFVDSAPLVPNDLIYYNTATDRLIVPNDYTAKDTFPIDSDSDFEFKLSTAGYVRIDDVTATSYDEVTLLDIANNGNIQEGDTVWLGFKENGDWDVLRYTRSDASIAEVILNPETQEFTFTTNKPHALSVGDIISITQFSSEINGVYVVKDVPGVSRIVVDAAVDFITTSLLSKSGLLFKFASARFKDFDNLPNDSDLLDLPDGSKFWVDKDNNGKWKVYQKVNNFASIANNGTFDDEQIGFSISKRKGNNKFVVGSPAFHAGNVYGKVTLYEKYENTNIGISEFFLTDSLNTYFNRVASPVTEYGYCVVYDDIEDSKWHNAWSTSTSYTTGAVVTYGDSVYTANATTMSSDDIDLTQWDRLNFGLVIVGAPGVSYVGTGTTTYSSCVQQGIVKISSVDSLLFVETPKYILSTTVSSNYQRFGSSIFVERGIGSNKTLLVGAPGTLSTGTGSVYSYSITTANTSTFGLTTGTQLYSTSTITLNTGSQWGYSIAGSDDANIIAIGAPGYKATGGVVQIFNNLTFSQTITSPFGARSRFGEKIVVTADGKELYISAPFAKNSNNSIGAVAIYTSTNTSFVLKQTLINPAKGAGMNFGKDIDITSEGDILVVSAVGNSKNLLTTFDKNTFGLTTFDAGSTEFFANLKDSGTVYVYERNNSRFVLADDLESEDPVAGSRYGTSIAVDSNVILVGAPSKLGETTSTLTTSTIYQFNKVDDTVNGLNVVSEQDDPIMINAVQKVALIDSFTEEIIDYIDVVDPLKGKIVGLAEQELKYKSAFDPAVYSVGTSANVVDPNTCWLDNHIGELWWDLSTTKYMWYEQSDLAYRKNNWGRLFPGATIDVYEWVGSVYLPSVWSIKADTPTGLTEGISGQPKVIDDSVASYKQVYDPMTDSFSNVYYYWVKNKITIPDVKNRRASAYQVSSMISDPATYGMKYAAIIDSDAIALANVGPLLVDNRIHLNVSVDSSNKNLPETNTLKHTEWLLLQEGSATSRPNVLLEKKLLDSLIGHDSLGNPVPDPSLSSRTRYGIGIRPQQTLFKDRQAALRNLVEFTNSVLIKNRITDSYSFNNLNKQDTIPDVYTHEYDQIVEDNEGLLIIDTRLFSKPVLTCTVDNGKIRSVTIVNPGFGYKISPTISIVSNVKSDAVITTEIDLVGRIISAKIVNPGNGFTIAPILEARQYTVIVQADTQFNGKWSKFVYNLDTAQWTRIGTQTYNTPLYWNYVDWSSTDYNQYVDYITTVDDVYQVSTLDLTAGQYVKVKNSGSGSYAILEKVAEGKVGTFSTDFNIVYSENGTIQISDTIWNTTNSNLGFDQVDGFDQTLYDQTPDLELQYILSALKNDIFINELKINWNLFFFKAVKYALTEQKLLDWAFKTSFINVVNDAGLLDQRPVYKLSNTDYYEQYLNEVKPYRTNIRTFTANHTTIDPTQTYTTDFDLPPVYNKTSGMFESVEAGSDKLTQYPWKSWADNNTYKVSNVAIGISGNGYSTIPAINLVTAPGDTGSGATAVAYIGSGQVTSIKVTNPGSGYTKAPIVVINGGGNALLTKAVAYAQLANGKIRTNQISMKFDRVGGTDQIGARTVTDKFICNGAATEFTLSWLAKAYKAGINITLDGNLVLSSDFTIEYYSEEYNGYRKKFSKIVFLNYVPQVNQVLEITYSKSSQLFNSAERIIDYYKPTSGMPGLELDQLITGIDYPKTKIEGLLFTSTQAWDTLNPNGEGTPFGQSSYADNIGYYTKIASSFTSTLINTGTQTSVVLSTTTGLVVGQFVNVISTITNAFTSSTVKVTSVNQSTRTVTFNAPTVATLNTGSVFEFWTYDANSSLLDSAIDGGNLLYSTAVGINPADINIEGDKFFSANTSHAPEEFVPGQASESIGINVYTRNATGSPAVFTGAIPVTANTSTVRELGMRPISVNNITVSFNNKLFTFTTTNLSTTLDLPAYNMLWDTNEIVVGPQSVSGYLGYTVVSIGGGNADYEVGAIDTAVSVGAPDVLYEDVNSPAIQVVSLSSYDTVKSAYVTLNGVPVPQGASGNTFYELTYANSQDRRAAVNVKNIPSGQTNTVQAWFFGTQYDYYNEIREEIINVSAFSTSTTYDSTSTILHPLGNYEPIVASTIVEYYNPNTKLRTRLIPPNIDYYQILSSGDNTFVIENEGTFNALDGTVRVYKNGSKLRGGFDFTVVGKIVTVTVSLQAGDVIAVLDKPTGIEHDYQYDIEINVDNIPKLTLSPYVGSQLGWTSTSTGEIRVLTYTDNDNMLIRTERFDGNPTRRFKISQSIENIRYVWVELNGVPLTASLDYEVLDDQITIQISDSYRIKTTDFVVIKSMVSQKLATTVLGYRIFNDMFNRTHFKRLSKKDTTYLTQPLKFTDTEIHVADASVLAPPFLAMNIPGVVIIDGERIEFFTVGKNTLGQIRRSTLGTAPSFYSDVGTKVIDQSPGQTIPFTEVVKTQTLFVGTETNTYTINTSTFGTVIPAGIEYSFVSTATAILNTNTIALNTTSNISVGSIVSNIVSGFKTSNIIPEDTKVVSVSTGSIIISAPITGPLPIGSIFAFGLTDIIPSDGITLSTATSINAVDQVQIYYGGRLLRKAGYYKHDTTVSYDSPDLKGIEIGTTSTIAGLPYAYQVGTAYTVTATNQVWVYTGSLDADAVNGYVYRGTDYIPSEFSINTSTQSVTLNINGGLAKNVKLQIIKKEFNTVWNDIDPTNSNKTLSIMNSTSTQARFLQSAPAELPDKYYYGGDLALTTSGGSPLTDIDNNPLEGF